MKYKTIDHIVITTENLEACLHFYVDILGMRAEEKNGRYLRDPDGNLIELASYEG